MQLWPGQAESSRQHRIRAVGEVPDTWMPDGREMNPDLVGPFGFQADVEQCHGPKRLLGGVLGNARATAADDRELVVSERIPADRGVNRAARRIVMALSE